MAIYGWIGLGNMGGPMTANLIQAGHTVKGYDLDQQALEDATATGVTAVDSIAEAVDGADVVFTMLPKGEHVRTVLTAEDGVFAHASTFTLLIDSSTVDPETSRWCHQEAARRGFDFVDAPVSGGISGAAAGTLTFMVGGEDDVVAAAQSFIEPMAGMIAAAGEATHGIAAKLANNMMLSISLLAASEGSQLADRLGLDPKVFWDIVSVSSGQSWAQKTWYPVPNIVDSAASNNNYDATFSAELCLKDVSLALEAGETAGLQLAGASLAKHQLEELAAEGLGHKDCSLVTKYVSPDGSAPGYQGEVGASTDSAMAGARDSARADEPAEPTQTEPIPEQPSTADVAAAPTAAASTSQAS